MPPENAIHLEVEAGPDRGRGLHVPATGVRIGRSTQNEVELTDPAVSRFQCRVFFKDDGTLWVSDLGSTNQTLVNRQPVIEQALKSGDGIEMGDTIIRVLQAQRDVEPLPLNPSPAPTPPPPAMRVDLGLQPSPTPPEVRSATTKKTSKGLYITVAVALVAVLAAVAGKKMLTPRAATTRTADLPMLEIAYEKVKASPSNIFRYALTLEGRRLRVQVDSLSEERHVQKEREISEDNLARLTADLEALSFSQLDPSYQGIIPEVHESADLTITLAERAHRVYVLNRVEPEVFERARSIIEEFARNELGLAAVSLPPEKLQELGRDAVLLGKKLFQEREVQYANLWKAIQAFEEAQWYSETLEPKPEFFADAVSGAEESKRVLTEMYENYKFQSDRAIQLKDWPAAAQHLQVICELIPEREDPRHADATKRLLDVESRVKR